MLDISLLRGEWMMILNRRPSLRGEERINLSVPRLHLFNTLMGFLMRKGRNGTVHNGLYLRGSATFTCLPVWGRAGGFLILLTCFNFPGPSARSPLPQQPCESFPFDFSLICATRKKCISIYLPAGVNAEAGFEFYVEGPHLNIWPAFVLPAAYRKLMIDRGPNVTEEMAFAMNVLFSPMSPTSHSYNGKCKCYAEC